MLGSKVTLNRFEVSMNAAFGTFGSELRTKKSLPNQPWAPKGFGYRVSGTNYVSLDIAWIYLGFLEVFVVASGDVCLSGVRSAVSRLPSPLPVAPVPPVVPHVVCR